MTDQGRLHEEIPSAWRTYFESVTNERTLQTLHDIGAERRGKVASRVLDMIHQIETMVGT
jgi:hypothetical protein